MPTMSSATPDFSLPKGWPFVGQDPKLDWAERLIKGSLEPLRATDDAKTALPSAADLAPQRGSINTTSLTAALAGIVVIAAQRALAAGDLPKLRDAIDRAFDSVLGQAEATDPRENGMGELPGIADAQQTVEAWRLSHLMQRQSII